MRQREMHALADLVLGPKDSPRKLSARTIKDYDATIQMLSRVKQTPEEYACANPGLSRSRYYGIRGAWLWGCARLVRHLLTQADRAAMEGNPSEAKAYRAKAEGWAKRLEVARPDPACRRAQKGELATWRLQGHDLTFPPRGRHSKRKSLSGLPGDWRVRLIDELPRQHKLAALVLAVSGCRPAELAKGVELATGNDGRLVVRITGAKTGQGHGHARRTLTFQPQSVIEKRLLDYVREQGGKVLVETKCTRQNLHQVFKRAVRAALGAKGEKVSLYSFRQQFSADLKAAGIDRERVALAMGHASDATQAFYGLSQQGGRGCGLDHAEGSQEVRKRYSPPALSQGAPEI